MDPRIRIPLFREGKQSACPTLSVLAPPENRRFPGGSPDPLYGGIHETKKEKRITLRLTPEQYEAIQSKADTAQMSTGAYVRTAALRHRVVVIGGLKEFTHELKGIGRNLNQLVVLSNMGKIQDVYLGETMEALGQIYCQLRELAELEKR